MITQKMYDHLSDTLDDINSALDVTSYSESVTGENALDAIKDMKDLIARLVKELDYYKRMISDANERKFPEIVKK